MMVLPRAEIFELKFRVSGDAMQGIESMHVSAVLIECGQVNLATNWC